MEKFWSRYELWIQIEFLKRTQRSQELIFLFNEMKSDPPLTQTAERLKASISDEGQPGDRKSIQQSLAPPRPAPPSYWGPSGKKILLWVTRNMGESICISICISLLGPYLPLLMNSESGKWVSASFAAPIICRFAREPGWTSKCDLVSVFRMQGREPKQLRRRISWNSNDKCWAGNSAACKKQHSNM